MSPHRPAKWMFVLLASACSVLGQTPPPGGARPLDVIVLDQSRLPVPGAEVEIALGNQPTATVFSDQSGCTVFPLRKPGRYTIRVSKAGFETAAVPDFAWDEAAPASLEVTLMAAGTKESIEVHAEASAVALPPRRVPVSARTRHRHRRVRSVSPYRYRRERQLLSDSVPGGVWGVSRRESSRKLYFSHGFDYELRKTFGSHASVSVQPEKDRRIQCLYPSRLDRFRHRTLQLHRDCFRQMEYLSPTFALRRFCNS